MTMELEPLTDEELKDLVGIRATARMGFTYAVFSVKNWLRQVSVWTSEWKASK